MPLGLDIADGEADLAAAKRNADTMPSPEMTAAPSSR